MRTLYLLRHGKSAWDDPDLADHERPLAPRGRKAAQRIGSHLREQGVRLDLVLCSTARRAADTLDLVLAAAECAPTIERERGLYLCGARVLLERLRDAPDDATHLMLVAHNPDLHDLATLLAGSGGDADLAALREKFPTAACAILHFETDRWRDLEPAGGRLAEFARPRALP